MRFVFGDKCLAVNHLNNATPEMRGMKGLDERGTTRNKCCGYGDG